jgi:serine/threonine protein kinase
MQQHASPQAAAAAGANHMPAARDQDQQHLLELAGQLVLVPAHERLQEHCIPPGCDAVRLLQVIGKGTFGVVYLGRWVSRTGGSNQAEAAGFKYDVAVKLAAACNTAHDEDWVALEEYMGMKRFAQLLAVGKLPLQDSAAAAAGPATGSSTGASPGVQQQPLPLVGLVMKLYQGSLESSKRHSEQEASELVLQVLQAIQDMHQGKGKSGLGMVHRFVRCLQREGDCGCLLACLGDAPYSQVCTQDASEPPQVVGQAVRHQRL